MKHEANIEGIPKSLVHHRDKRFVAQPFNIQTLCQFLQILSEAGLK
jgi:hypothetical protein